MQVSQEEFVEECLRTLAQAERQSIGGLVNKLAK